MYIIENRTGKKHSVVIKPVIDADYNRITKQQFFFNWRTERNNKVYKLMLAESREILGLISLMEYPAEKRMEVNLISVSRNNPGENKKYERIAGCMLAFACIEAVKLFEENACLSLLPKTKLKEHYMNKYGMADAGKQLFLDDISLTSMIKRYKYDN